MEEGLGSSRRPQKTKRAGSSSSSLLLLYGTFALALVASLASFLFFTPDTALLNEYYHRSRLEQFLNRNRTSLKIKSETKAFLDKDKTSGGETSDGDEVPANTKDVSITTTTPDSTLIPAFQSVLNRSKHFFQYCKDLNLPLNPFNISLEADLPPFGIIDTLTNYQETSISDWQCLVPPPTECEITQFSVIMMGYNPARLGMMKREIDKFLRGRGFRDVVAEVLLVWNNPESMETLNNDGKVLFEWASSTTHPFDANQPINPFRIFLPSENGLGNDLMNRYHPKIQPKSKALLYYDDDGPFYSYKAILSAFELWRRNSDAQLGAMPRAFTFSPRQRVERQQVMGEEIDDRKFVSHCRDCGDVVDYDFREFTPFHANMVLPSGSFLHRNYLCFLWHPALEPIRQFVKEHPVHPDDVTVSTIVSQLSGRSPLTYSRRLPENRRRRLQETNETASIERASMRRRLLWDDAEKKAQWGQWRSMAVNSLVSYFGSLTTGSLGWCYKTKYHKQKGEKHICDPEIARANQIPWLQEGGYRYDVCPLIETQ